MGEMSTDQPNQLRKSNTTASVQPSTVKQDKVPIIAVENSSGSPASESHLSNADTEVPTSPQDTNNVSVSPELVDLHLRASVKSATVPLAHSLSPSVEDFEQFRYHRKSADLSAYFQGPREFDRHSKWPMFMRIQGSVLPKMIIPMLFVAAWSSAITAVHHLKHPLGLSNVLLTVLGFVVGLALSFRNATGYERYTEGRKYWQMLTQTADTLGRTIWVNVHEREDSSVEDLLQKISALNMVAAFGHSLMHRLRFEPYMDYEDMFGLVGHLDTLARAATDFEADEKVDLKKKNSIRAKIMKAMQNYGGSYLGIPFAEVNPRTDIKNATAPVGNLPLEIINYLSTYVEYVISSGMVPTPAFQIHLANSLLALNEVLTGCERILNTPLPLAYGIAISQITWLYIMVLPFQLVVPLGWIAIPGTLVAGYIILGMQMIGQEVENPFGNDVNDLPLEQFCAFISQDIDIISSHKPMDSPSKFMNVPANKVLYPVSTNGYNVWKHRSEDKIHDKLKAKTLISVSSPGLSPTDTPAGTNAKPTPSGTFNYV